MSWDPSHFQVQGRWGKQEACWLQTKPAHDPHPRGAKAMPLPPPRNSAHTWGTWSMLNSRGSFRLSISELGWDGRWWTAAPRRRLRVLTWPGVCVASRCQGCFPARGWREEIQSAPAQLQLDQDSDCLTTEQTLATAK